MNRTGLTALTGLCCALLVFSVALVGRIPTSACPCNDLPTEETARDADCPFGKLRTLSSHLLPSATLEISRPSELVGASVLSFLSYEMAASFKFAARAPPAS
jgi:hypothetical protein